MKIVAIQENSIAEVAGLQCGEDILAVNGEVVRDSLDFLFRAAEEIVRLRIRRVSGETRQVTLEREPGVDLGLRLAPDPVQRCRNRCIFCFIDQNPRGLRRNLYVKDEDYRLSLLYGNYITMTHLREWEIERIIEQQLSPLYVSVHATQPGVRQNLLRCPDAAEILPLLKRLTGEGIRIHAQIVLVPGYNDGPALEGTLDDLEALHPGVASVAVVPVGLTGHRQGLPPLRRVSPAEARHVVARIEERQQICLKALGSCLHFAADEFYLLAGMRLPAERVYEDFPQVENGVGMVRRFEQDLGRMTRLFPDLPAGNGIPDGRRARIVVATGRLFAGILGKRLAEALRRTAEAETCELEIRGVENRLFGSEVTVAGLLSGGDLLAGLRNADPFDLAVVSPEMLNLEGVALDEMTPAAIARELGAPVQVGFGDESVLVRPDASDGDSRRQAKETGS